MWCFSSATSRCGSLLLSRSVSPDGRSLDDVIMAHAPLSRCTSHHHHRISPGTEVFNYSPLIYGYQLTNVAITGGGTLDGSGQAGFAQWASKQGDDQNAARQMGNDTTAVCTRQFGEGHFLRPAFVQMMGCRNLPVRKSPLATKNPLEDTDGLRRPLLKGGATQSISDLSMQ